MSIVEVIGISRLALVNTHVQVTRVNHGVICVNRLGMIKTKQDIASWHNRLIKDINRTCAQSGHPRQSLRSLTSLDIVFTKQTLRHYDITNTCTGHPRQSWSHWRQCLISVANKQLKDRDKRNQRVNKIRDKQRLSTTITSIDVIRHSVYKTDIASLWHNKHVHRSPTSIVESLTSVLN